MGQVVGDWKRWHETRSGVLWQDNFFDHRLRNAEALETKASYIRRNPVACNLCSSEEDWPWVIGAADLQT